MSPLKNPVPAVLVQDIAGSGAATALASEGVGSRVTASLAQGAEATIATLTQTYAPGSMVVAVGMAGIGAIGGVACTLRLYMDGVLVTESAQFTTSHVFRIITGIRQMSGSKTVTLKIYKVGAIGDVSYPGVNTSAGTTDKIAGGVAAVGII